MADTLSRLAYSLVSNTGTPVTLFTVQTPAAGFDKCILTALGAANKGTLPEQFYLTVTTGTDTALLGVAAGVQTAMTGGATFTAIPGQPIGVNDAYWSKPEVQVFLRPGDIVKVYTTQGQPVDVIMSVVMSDLS